MKRPLHISYGFITGSLLIIAMLVLYYTQIKINGNIQMFVVIGTVITGVITSCFALKKNNPQATTNEVFFNGFRTTAIIALLIIAFGVLFIVLIPGFKDNQIENFRLEQIKAANNDLVKLKAVTEDVADYKNKFTTMFIGINMMIIVISGLIGSAVGSILSKKN